MLTFYLTDAVAWRNKGLALADLNRYEEALVAYNEALKLDADNPRRWNSMAYAQAALKRYDNTLLSIERAIALAPENANFYDSKGEILMMAGRYDEALPPFKEAVRLDPSLLESWQKLVTVYRKLGRETNALEAERIFLLEPDEMPLKWPNQQAWELEQERNVKYVALTRAKAELYRVSSSTN